MQYGTYSFTNVWPLTISTRGWHAIGHFGKIRSNWHVSAKIIVDYQFSKEIHPTKLSKTHIFDIFWNWGKFRCYSNHQRTEMWQQTKVYVLTYLNMCTHPGHSLVAMCDLWRNKACLKWKYGPRQARDERVKPTNQWKFMITKHCETQKWS